MSKKLTVYLAGPIEGLTLEQAVIWRENARQFLGEVGIETFDPMAGKRQIVAPGEIVGYQSYGYPEHPLYYLTKRDSLFHRDIMAIQKSDILLVNLSRVTGSVGTPWEMGYAYALGKTVIVVTTEPSIIHHPFVNMSSVIFNEIEDALAYISSALM